MRGGHAMRRRVIAPLALAAAAASFSLQAFGATPPTTYESFTATTDTYWDFVGNRASGQNYGWSNTDTTGTAASPLGGSATGPGELGGVIARSGTANYYGFNIGSVNPITDSFTASG